ncbi:MAG: hypothetical protein QOE24_272, partial [Frankiales bacterium]|nr:hypothetical protein [Frankiales bacterium]
MTAGPAWSTPVAATLTDRLAALDRALGLAGERFGDAETAPAEALLEHAR